MKYFLTAYLAKKDNITLCHGNVWVTVEEGKPILFGLLKRQIAKKFGCTGPNEITITGCIEITKEQFEELEAEGIN